MAGCQETVEPGGSGEQPPVFAGLSFLPEQPEVGVVRGTYADFRVVGGERLDLRLRWHRPGDEAAVGPRYRYFPRQLGPDTLTVRIQDAAGRTDQHTWIISVVPAAELSVDFQPPGPVSELYETQATTFVAATPWPLAAATWRLDGATVGHDSTYVFPAESAGAYELAAAVQIADSTFTYAWSVLVRPLAEGRPPQVEDLVLAPGDAPGRAILSWARTDPTVFPLSSYEVRYRFEGPLSEEIWAEAVDPGDYPWVANQLRHAVAYTPENAGLEPERDVWFAVRARDDRGLLSPLGESVHLRLPGEWWIEGTTAAPNGSPLEGIEVADLERRHTVRSGADGSFRIGPYFELTRVVLMAGLRPYAGPETGWHFARSDTLSAAVAGPQEFRLIPRHETVADCFTFGSNFLWYLRTMTLTRSPRLHRPNVRLYRWEEYPVPVHVPDWVSPTDVDYAAACRDAIAIWNASLSSPILTVVDDPDAARIVFRYDLDDGINYGLTIVDEPGGGDYIIGEVTPERVTLAIAPVMVTAQPVTETAMHELGHALGMYGHANCVKIPYLMNITARGSLDAGPENAIHPDERLAVEIIRALPNGWDMSKYPLDAP